MAILEEVVNIISSFLASDWSTIVILVSIIAIYWALTYRGAWGELSSIYPGTRRKLPGKSIGGVVGVFYSTEQPLYNGLVEVRISDGKLVIQGISLLRRFTPAISIPQKDLLNPVLAGIKYFGQMPEFEIEKATGIRLRLNKRIVKAMEANK